MVVRAIGFRAFSAPVRIRDGSGARVDAVLVPVAYTVSAVEVRAESPLAVNTRTGDQTFQQDSYHGSPTTPPSQILQQSVAGAARAPTGEVHIRGQHAEYTYIVDGIPVPSGVSGSINELFDPGIVNRIDFKTGGWDAEYGNKNAAIVEVATRIPTGGFHASASLFGGSFGTSGQGLSASQNDGRWGFYGALSRQATDMRREPIAFDTLTYAPRNFHNHGEDLFAFGKVQFTPGASDQFVLNANWSRTRFEVPYDSSGGIRSDARQEDQNAFLNLGWRHRFDGGLDSSGTPGTGGELFAGAFLRTGSLRFTPGAADSAQFIFYPDTLTPYKLTEDRTFTTVGFKLDYARRVTRHVEFKTGVLGQFTSGNEDFVARTAAGSAGPRSQSALDGHDVGLYAQGGYQPVEWLEVRAGLRWDSHRAPFAGTQAQWSPRLRINVFPDEATTLFAYYGRQFIPTNVEDLRAITSVAQGGVVAAPTLPERDDVYEVGLVHRFPFGVVSKFSAYYKRSTPGIDDNTVPGSSIVTPVNIQEVRVKGLEAVLEVRPGGALSGSLNLSLNHAYGFGTITGGFFPDAPPTGAFDLDHDQRLSAVASATWAPSRFYLSATGIYGSGLTNGVEPAACGCRFGTGLTDFNPGIKVSPNFVLNLGTGYAWLVGRTLVQPELFIDNLFDTRYLLKGAFFSGASVGRPRSIQVRVKAAI
ncbi:MAG: TonB-dependent receptor [Gemmatimonadetes bacterium]|nr:TonB-dependent receptor [Gemmatimonadota bacterium]